MNGTSNTEPPAEPQGERLTLGQARNSLVVLLCLALFLSAFGLHLFFEGKKVLAGTCCLGALAISASLLAVLKQYRLVKTGTVVIIQGQGSPNVHPSVSILMIALLTIMVLFMGAVTLYILPFALRSFTSRIFFVGFNLFLWLVTGFLWYRILTERRKTPLVKPVYEQEEGVWPPAPQIPKNE